jgi:hypothetical protein
MKFVSSEKSNPLVFAHGSAAELSVTFSDGFGGGHVMIALAQSSDGGRPPPASPDNTGAGVRLVALKVQRRNASAAFSSPSLLPEDETRTTARTRPSASTATRKTAG